MTLQLDRVELNNPGHFDSAKIICEVTGRQFPDHKTLVYYRDKTTKHEYTYIVGAFSPPGFDKPGFSVVIGYDKKKDPGYKKRLIRVLAEHEGSGKDLASMVKGMAWLKKYYGTPPLLEGWYAHLSELMQAKISEEISKIRGGFCVSLPPYQFYASPVQEYLRTLIEFSPICDMGRCYKLRGYAEKGPRNETEAFQFRPMQNPALMAFAVAVSGLMVDKPWTVEEEPLSMGAFNDSAVGSYGSFGDEAIFE